MKFLDGNVLKDGHNEKVSHLQELYPGNVSREMIKNNFKLIK